MAIERIDECGEVSVLWIPGKGISYPVLVDTEDVERILAFPGSWHLNYGKIRNYVRAASCRGVNPQVYVHLSRFVLRASGVLDVGHRNEDGLDNRKQNLCELTNQMVALKRLRPNRNSQSGIRGVTWAKDKQKWRAQIQIGGKHHGLGHFTDRLEAAAAFRAAQEKAA